MKTKHAFSHRRSKAVACSPGNSFGNRVFGIGWPLEVVDQARAAWRGLFAFRCFFVPGVPALRFFSSASFCSVYHPRHAIASMPVIRKRRTWLESHDYRRHRRRREFWLVLGGALAFAAV